MTQISVPKPSHSSRPQKETVVTAIHLKLGRHHYEARTFDGGETSTIYVEKIEDSSGQEITPVWEADWVEVAPGIKTKSNDVEIQSFACPVRISFKQERQGRTWNRRTDEDEYYTATDLYEICYEAEALEHAIAPPQNP